MIEISMIGEFMQDVILSTVLFASTNHIL